MPGLGIGLGTGQISERRLRGHEGLVSFDQVAAVYERTALEPGPGEVLLLT